MQRNGKSLLGGPRTPLLGASLVCALAVIALSGCVERRLAFYSSDESVPVSIELDGVPIGETPCEVKFLRYGRREWVARADGFEIASGTIELSPPWYQYPPFDLLVEGFFPFTVTDEHEVTVTLEALKKRDPDEFYDRAKALKRKATGEIQAASDRIAEEETRRASK